MCLRWPRPSTMPATPHLRSPHTPPVMTPSPSRPKATTTSSAASRATAPSARRWTSTSPSPPLLPLPPPRLLPLPQAAAAAAAAAVVVPDASLHRQLPRRLALARSPCHRRLLLFSLSSPSLPWPVALLGTSGCLSWVVSNKLGSSSSDWCAHFWRCGD